MSVATQGANLLLEKLFVLMLLLTMDSHLREHVGLHSTLFASFTEAGSGLSPASGGSLS